MHSDQHAPNTQSAASTSAATSISVGDNAAAAVAQPPLALDPSHWTPVSTPLPSSFYTSHSTSLLLSLAMLPLSDLAAAACVSRHWYALVARDSQQLAWRWQKHEERRKFRLRARRQSQQLTDATAAGHDHVAVAAALAAAARDREEESNPHLPFGPHAPLVEECRAVLLRATARAYFLRQGLGLLPREQQAAESPIYDTDTGLVRPAYSWPSEAAPPLLPVATPLLLHLRSLRLSLHCDFTPVYARFLTALPHLTSLGLVVTNLWPMDSAAVQDAFRGLASKRIPLLSLTIEFMDLQGGSGDERNRRLSSAASSPDSSPTGGASSPVASSSSASSSVAPAHLRDNYLALFAAITHLSSLRVLKLSGVTSAMDDDSQLSWLGDARGHARFPQLVQLVLPRGLGKTARRIFAVRTLQPALQELVWPDWGSLIDLTLMVGTAAREASLARSALQRRRQAALAAGEPPDRRDGDEFAASSSVYIPPPLRAPVPGLTCFALDGPLVDLHLRAIHTLAPSLRKLAVLDTNTAAASSSLSWAGLAPFVDGTMHDDDEAEGDERALGSSQPAHSSSPSCAVGGGGGGLEELSMSCAQWSSTRLASLQSCGAWPRLRRLTIACDVPAHAHASGEPAPSQSHHSLSVSNSAFQPSRFFHNFGVHNQLQQLAIRGLPLSGLGCIASAAWTHSSSLHTLVLERVSELSTRSLRQLLHLRGSLRHLQLIQVDGLCVEDLDELLPQSVRASAAASTNRDIDAEGAGDSDGQRPPTTAMFAPGGGLQLESFRFALSSARWDRGVTSVQFCYRRLLQLERSHPMMQPPYSTSDELRLPLSELPTRSCVNAWSAHRLQEWRSRMEQCAGNENGDSHDATQLQPDDVGDGRQRQCGPAPRIQLWFKPLATQAASRPEWRLLERED